MTRGGAPAAHGRNFVREIANHGPVVARQQSACAPRANRAPVANRKRGVPFAPRACADEQGSLFHLTASIEFDDFAECVSAVPR